MDKKHPSATAAKPKGIRERVIEDLANWYDKRIELLEKLIGLDGEGEDVNLKTMHIDAAEACMKAAGSAPRRGGRTAGRPRPPRTAAVGA